MKVYVIMKMSVAGRQLKSIWQDKKQAEDELSNLRNRNINTEAYYLQEEEVQ